MKKYQFTILFFVALSFSCSKAKNNVLPKEDNISIVSREKPPITPNLADDGKKYNPIICYIPGNPNVVGTECSVIGDKCKSSACTISAGSKSAVKLTIAEIDKYALIDANELLQKGLIDKKDFEYFQNFSKTLLIERNKTLK